MTAVTVMGLVVTLCALPILVARFALYIRDEAGLVVDRAGLDDRSTLLSMGRVPWGDLTWHEVDSSAGLLVELSPAAVETWRSRSWLRRRLKWHVVGVVFDNLDAERSEILAAFKRLGAERQLVDAPSGEPPVVEAEEASEDLGAFSLPTLGWRHSGSGSVAW